MSSRRKKILIVDDEKSIRDSMRLLLGDSFVVETLESGEAALSELAKIKPDLVFLDVFLPGLDGIDILKAIKKANDKLPVVMLSGSNTIKTAVQAMKLGAVDYINKPFKVEELTELIVDTLSISDSPKQTKPSREIQSRIVGSSQKMLGVLKKVSLVAPHDTTVLITGESGTGKELVAREIHTQSSRSSKAFVAINCAAIPENLIESELFGHERGAFTGANRQRKGLFEQGNGGTVFLDEVGELTLSTQVKLLRFLQEQEFFRVGGTEPIKVDVRILAATNRDLDSLVKKEKYREDLFYRINVINLALPALRDRHNDIQELINYFSSEFRKKYQNKKLNFSNKALYKMQNYPWPGNVRELENVIESLFALMPAGEVDLSDLPPKIQKVSLADGVEITNTDHFNLGDASQKFEAEMIIKALEKTDYVQTRAAELLGVSRRILKYKIDKFGIDLER